MNSKDPNDNDDPDIDVGDAPGWDGLKDGDNDKKENKRDKTDVKEGLKRFGEKIGQTVAKTGQKIGQTMEKVSEKIETVVSTTGDNIGKALGKVGDEVTKIGKSVGKNVKDFVDEKQRSKREFDDAVQKELEKMKQNQPEKPKPKEEVWQDISIEGFQKKIDAEYQQPLNAPKQDTIVKTNQTNMESDPQSDMDFKSNLDLNELIFKSMTQTMREAYLEAQECLKNGQESIALQYFELIITEAKQKNMPLIVDFIQEQIKKIF